MNELLPITPAQAIRAAKWLSDNFNYEITDALHDTPYSFELIAAIFSQETAQRVQLWFNDYDAATILQRCVFDASGDFPGTTRHAFPRNMGEFHTAYGDEFTDMLISEANKMRHMPQPGDKDGYGDSHYLYKGYGIFQYDLQHVKTDEVFFLNKLWYNMTDCLDRLIKELNSKYNGDLHECVRKYNGAGVNAENYARNVMEFAGIIKGG